MFHLKYIFFLLTLLHLSSNKQADVPVIAILANPDPYNASNITASRVNSQYVRWIEQSYAEVVVIQPWYQEKEIDEVLNKVNGVLWPGGDRDLRLGGQFEQTAGLILRRLMKLYNEQGIRLPLWGTCQGLELIAVELANSTDVLTRFSAWDLQRSLIFNMTMPPYLTEMFKELSRKEWDIIQKENVTAHFHNWGVSKSNFDEFGLDKFLKITSYSKDMNNNTFIASFEGIKYPIYGVQFHPEMIQYKKSNLKGIPRSPSAVKISQKLSNFFLDQARLNTNKMNAEDLKKFDHINSYADEMVYENGSYYYVYTKYREKLRNEIA